MHSLIERRGGPEGRAVRPGVHQAPDGAHQRMPRTPWVRLVGSWAPDVLGTGVGLVALLASMPPG